MKRTYSDLTTYESQTQSMPGNAASGSRYKRRRWTSRLRIPRSVAPGAGGNKCIIALTNTGDYNLTADVARTFSFDTANVYVNGSAAAIGGASEVAAVFEYMRIHKVEMTILPAANSLAYNDQNLASGQTNIPYVYTAIDYSDDDAPTLAEMRQNHTLRLDSLDKPIKRTFYPRLDGSNGVIDVGSNARNHFMRSGNTSSQRWHGMKIYIDMNNEVWTYSQVRICMKVYFECMQSK